MAVASKLRSRQFTPAELELMNILWDGGPATVQMIVERLPPNRKLAYTTVQTVLNVLHRKGKVKRTLKGRTFHYQPAVTRFSVASNAIRDLVKGLFGGSPEKLILTMVEAQDLTPAKIDELQQVIRSAGKSNKKTPS